MGRVLARGTGGGAGLVLGSGRRLFPADGTVSALRLADAEPTSTGVLIATYHPAT